MRQCQLGSGSQAGRYRRRRWPWAAWATSAMLMGCASQVPPEIRQAPQPTATLQQVQTAPQRHSGARVRWGGTILELQNRQRHSVMEIVARPLQSDGRPLEDARSPGRFLARVAGFLDPAVYEQDRAVTVVGHVAGTETRMIGEFSYVYPVVEVQRHHLWEPLPEPAPWRYDPFWYDPLFPDPFWHRRIHPYW